MKAEVGAIAREVRRMQMDVLERLLPEYGIDPTVFPPPLVATLERLEAHQTTRRR